MQNSPHSNTTALRPVAPLNIIADKLGTLVQQAQLIEGLSPSFISGLQEATRLAQGLEPYTEACTTPESPALSRLVAATQAENWAQHYSSGGTSVMLEQEMLSGHVEGQLLKCLIDVMKATRVLEIGLFTGYSALAMAEALPHNGRLVACELDPYVAAFAERAFAQSPHGEKIRVLVGEALFSLHQLQETGDTFDLIFIDADKPNYRTYLDLVLTGSLLAPHGLICVDNTLLQGQPYMPDEPTANGRAIAEFNRIVQEDPRVEQVLLPLRDGLTLIRRT